MSNYKANKADAVYINTEPTMTDQSQAANTDINIIVNQFIRTGQAPQGAEPIYADFADLPDDLRGFIEMGRTINTLKSQLPEQLRDLPPAELFRLTDAELLARLTPPEQATTQETKE